MKIDVNVKRKFRINGKEYGSLEEMPGDVRAAFEKAAASAGEEDAGTQVKKSSKIVFNGIEYASLDEMPTYARNLYERAMAAAAADSAEDSDLRRDSHAVRTEPSFSAKSVVAVIALIAFALLLYYLFSSR